MGEPYDFQIITVSKDEEKNEAKRRHIENDNLYKRVIALYEEGRKKDKEVFRDNIRLTPEKIRTVVGYLESVNLSETDLDSKGRAFETFMGSFLEAISVNILHLVRLSNLLSMYCLSNTTLKFLIARVEVEVSCSMH